MDTPKRTVTSRPSIRRITLRNARMRHTVDEVVRRVFLPLLMLAVLLPSAAFARISYLCGTDGKVRSTCCCPSKAKERDPAPVTTIKGACCCEVSTIAPNTTAAIDPPKASSNAQLEPVVITTTTFVELPWQRVTILAPRANAPPDNPGRSLFASHCALLL